MAVIINAKNLAQMYSDSAQKFAQRPAFATKIKGSEWESVSYKEIFDFGVNLATALIDLGIKQNEHIGFLADNRLEWMIAHLEARRAMADAALTRVQSLGGWADYAGAVERMYRQLLGEDVSWTGNDTQRRWDGLRAANGAAPVVP